MTEQEIKEYICVRFPQENESCEWKEYKNLQNSLCGHEADDVVSYVSAISNMNGGSLIIGVKDQTLDVIGIQNLGSYNVDSAKARNVKYRIVRPNSLFPDEMLRYDMFNIREPLNNAIAHQDYTKCARIDVVEYEDDHLIFQNYGSFLPSSIEEVVEEDCPQSIYRNRFLVEAMRNLNMIETEGGGIADVQAKYLRKRKFIEGRKPKYYLSYEIVSASNDSVLKRQYVKNKSFDDDYFRKLILNYLEKFEKASRNDIDLLLEDKLSDVLNEKQKKNKIDYLMKQLRLSKLIVCGKGKLWKLV